MKNFYHFHDGEQVSNRSINSWLSECRDKCIEDETQSHHSMSSGDTLISCHKWNFSIEFNVSTNSGYSSISFSLTEDDWMNYEFNYVRPTKENQ